MDPAEPLNTELPPSKKSKKLKCLKICCGVTIILILIIVAVLLFLRFYLFRTRAPEITTNDVILEDFASTTFPAPVSLKITLGMVIGLKNPNYAGFDYQGTNTTVTYHETDVGLAFLNAGVVNARSSSKIHTTVYIDTGKIMASQSFLPDMILGALPLNTTTTLVGEVVVFKVLKLRATVTTFCAVSISIATSSSTSDCTSDVKL